MTGTPYVPPWQHGGGTDTEIRASTESRPWRRKFSRRSSRDSNPRPFNHESGALTTELSPPLFETVLPGEVTSTTYTPPIASVHASMRANRPFRLSPYRVSAFRTFQPELPVPAMSSRNRLERDVSPRKLHRLTSTVGIAPLTDHHAEHRRF